MEIFCVIKISKNQMRICHFSQSDIYLLDILTDLGMFFW